MSDDPLSPSTPRGSFTAGLFYHAETLLSTPEAKERYRAALEFAGKRKTSKIALARSLSLIDFIFCKLASPSYREACQQFYHKNGPALSGLSDISPFQVAEWDLLIMRVLKLAAERHDKKSSRTWASLIQGAKIAQ